MQNDPSADTAPSWLQGPLSELWQWPLTYENHSGFDRLLHRCLVAILRTRVVRLEGLERITGIGGPFIVAANHGCRRDALYLPVLLMMARHGRPVHFLADWNFKLIPGVAALYRKAGAITVNGKPARPRILNRLRPGLAGAPALPAARRVLAKGGAVALFPEGTTNRDPEHLLRGRHGCARLSLEFRAPVVPVGITYPRYADSARKPLHAGVAIRFGAALTPPSIAVRAPVALAEVRTWHARIMQEISRQSGKRW